MTQLYDDCFFNKSPLTAVKNGLNNVIFKMVTFFYIDLQSEKE